MTERMEIVLAALARLERPTLREWAFEARVPFGSIKYYRDELVSRGFVEFRPGTVRTIKMTRKGVAYGRNSV